MASAVTTTTAAQPATPERFRRDIRRAVSRSELGIAIQPIVDLADGRTSGWEALARWHHPTWGAIPPTEFIGAAERTGCIHTIGAWVLDRACAWRVQMCGDGAVGINVSAVELDDPHFAGRVFHTLESPG